MGRRFELPRDRRVFICNFEYYILVMHDLDLCFTAKLFDPLGFLSPITIAAKIFIQEIWSLKRDWDEPLPNQVALKWINFVDDLKELPKLTVPR